MSSGNPNTILEGLNFYGDFSNIKSFRGLPTNNLNREESDYTGNSYGSLDEYTTASQFLKSYNSTIKTPIGYGATLIKESGSDGYHYLSRFGSSDINNHSLSCYIYPLTDDLNDLHIGCLSDPTNCSRFNLVDETFIEGGGAIPSTTFIHKLEGDYKGWYRIGVNFGGRSGGWVGCIGNKSYTTYTGTSNKQLFYITGILHENTPGSTSYLSPSGVRDQYTSSGGGISDLSLNNKDAWFTSGNFIETKDVLPSIYTSGVDEGITITDPGISRDIFTIEVWIKPDVQSTTNYIVNPSSLGIDSYIRIGADNKIYTFFPIAADQGGDSLNSISIIPTHRYSQIVLVKTPQDIKLYVDGKLDNEKATTQVAGIWSGNWYLCKRGNNTYFYKGFIGITRIYNRGLSEDEILYNYNSTSPKYIL